ncbi:MAG: valine--tRNA ligase [Myxococcales bacterium]|nr:valine--tRNA ligase [Myxococcales bacterium]
MSPSDRHFRSIDPSTIPKHFDAIEAEQRWHRRWEESGIYHYDPSRPREETFVVDTPPPTVSGSLHIGHVFSFTHTDTVVRFQRMRGKNIFYPMGWDDNGVPTERRVQNYFHVRCNPHAPYEANLELEPATAKMRKQRPREVSRQNFIELCHVITQEDEKAFMELWQRVGLSVDWRQTYATIDDHCRKLSQLSFRDLFEKGHVYNVDAPFMWDVDFQMALSQADIEDRQQPGAFHDIEFGVDGEDRSFVISTTRPELLAACVGVTAHPEDERYRDLFGKHALTPLFQAPVPIFPSEGADPEKGTGILMVCTFGDSSDVDWWRQQKLPLRQVIGHNGRLLEIEFGSDEFPSRDAKAANHYYAELAGKNVKQARKAIAELLGDPAGSATGNGAPLQSDPKPVQHAVKFYEKGERPLEFIPTRQWFVRLLDKKEALLAKGEEIRWHPDFMKARYRDWTDGLQLDWCISRQRYFGVPIPVWYPLNAEGNPDHANPIVAARENLPVDPMVDLPAGFKAEQRDQPLGFTGEPDIFDTWFTSSMTPQIGSHWMLDEKRHANLFPADIRPQSHEIIRTWAFYTIAKAMLHEDKIPWSHVLISGWVLDPDRKKMSKSQGNVQTPMPMIERFTADGARYWSASARLGTDTASDEKIFKIGKRLSTKLFNAGKFVLQQTAEIHPITSELDRAFVTRLNELVDRSTRSFEDFDHAVVLKETESFFWTHFTDTYLELVKSRARAEDANAAAARGSAVASLRLGLDVLLRLFAPFLPYITEEIWSWVFAEEKTAPSIHRACWPGIEDFRGIDPPENAKSFEIAVACWNAINKSKADAEVSMGREATHLTIAANPDTLSLLGPVLDDVLLAVRCQNHQLTERAELEDGDFEILDAKFAPKPEKNAS